MADDFIHAGPVFDLAEDEGPIAAHLFRVPLHDREIGANSFGQIGLVYYQKICQGDSRAALSGDLVTARYVDDVNRVIGEFPAEVGGQIITTGLDQEHVWLEVLGQFFEGQEVHGYVFPDSGVGAATSLDGLDPVRLERFVAKQELRIFLCKNIVGDYGDIVIFSKSPAEGQQEGGLATADRAADSDRKRPLVIVPIQNRIAFVKLARMLEMFVSVAVAVAVRVIVMMVVFGIMHFGFTLLSTLKQTGVKEFMVGLMKVLHGTGVCEFLDRSIPTGVHDVLGKSSHLALNPLSFQRPNGI